MTRSEPSGYGPCSPLSWPLRGCGWILRVLVPWALVFQLTSSLLVGNAWPSDEQAIVPGLLAFLTVVLLTFVTARRGQSWAERILRHRVITVGGPPASRGRMALREVLHVLDLLPIGLGFLWALWDPQGQTFADKILGTRMVVSHSG